MNNTMELVVDVISREKIKPARPTPTHLKTHSLSFLDQIAGRNYVPVLLYFDGIKKNIDTRCSVLKKSLAETLTQFHLLAGKIVDGEIERFVDCNDDGVDFCETRVSNCQLSEVIKEPSFFEQLKLLLPFDPCDQEIPIATGASLLSVQVNVFEDCGGMVIGLLFNHKVADASSFSTFVNDWATIAHGMVVNDYDRKIKGPSFEVQSLFPQKENRMGFKVYVFPKDERQVLTKKFSFEACKLAELKERCKFANEAGDVPDGYKPTRVEALSTFLWKCFIDIHQAKLKAGSPSRVYLVTNAVNIRSRMVPKLPASSFGNMIAVADATFSVNNNESTDQYYPKLVQKFRDAGKKIDGEYIAALQSTDFIINHVNELMEQFFSGQTSMISFTSWCRFPLYDTNFGWGKPTWVSSCSAPLKNTILLMDSNSSGDGIEAYVTLAKEDMVEFERHEELLALLF